ncbi:hypothetical protein GYMLUDRAFT_127499, partial [Collybiopsis luxurians FD-317 M1]
ISSDDERIDIALSYIEGPKVQDWIQNLHDSYYNKNQETWGITWAWFKQVLNNQFLDRARVDKAQEEFKRIQQRVGEKAADFFTQLKICVNMAQYNKNDTFVVKKLERIVNTKIIDQIFGS